MTATQNAPSETTERRYATVNPFTGETEKEFPFTETSEIDGIIGLQTRAAAKDVQTKLGLPADSYPTVELLSRM